MEIPFSHFNWLAVVASVVAGQVISTIWFVVLFAQPWAREYGAKDAKEHTKAIPGYTYAVGALSTFALVISIATLQRWLMVDSVGEALKLGLLIAVGFCIATTVPGQAFLKRWKCAAMTAGSQTVMIIGISLILALWR